MRMRKSTSALESSTQQLFGISSMGNLGETGGSAGIIRPGTAPLMRSVGDSLKKLEPAVFKKIERKSIFVLLNF